MREAAVHTSSLALDPKLIMQKILIYHPESTMYHKQKIRHSYPRMHDPAGSPPEHPRRLVNAT